jgi:hypothetical protein
MAGRLNHTDYSSSRPWLLPSVEPLRHDRLAWEPFHGADQHRGFAFPDLPISGDKRQRLLAGAARLPLGRLAQSDIPSPRFLLADDGPLSV